MHKPLCADTSFDCIKAFSDVIWLERNISDQKPVRLRMPVLPLQKRKEGKCTPVTPALPLSPALDGHREAWGRFQTADEEVWGDEEALHWHIGNPWVIISISSVVKPWETDGPESPAIWRLAFSAYLCQVDFGKGEYISAHPFTKVTVFFPSLRGTWCWIEIDLWWQFSWCSWDVYSTKYVMSTEDCLRGTRGVFVTKICNATRNAAF